LDILYLLLLGNSTAAVVKPIYIIVMRVFRDNSNDLHDLYNTYFNRRENQLVYGWMDDTCLSLPDEKELEKYIEFVVREIRKGSNIKQSLEQFLLYF
jgi:hypothetical protein